MRLIYIALVCVVISLLLVTFTAFAGSKESQLTVSKDDTTPGITDFFVSVSDMDTEPAKWIETTGVWVFPVATGDYVHIRRDFNEYPSDRTKGDLVYQGALGTFIETINVLPNVVYYTAWVYGNDKTWSDPVYYVLDVGGEVTTINFSTFLLGIFGFLAVGSMVAGLAIKTGRSLMFVVGAGIWLLLGVYSYTLYKDAWDIYYALFFFSMFMVPICIFMPMAIARLNRPSPEIDVDNWGKDEPLRQAIEAEEQDRERTDRILGKRSKKSNKRKRSKFEDTGEL